MAFSCKTPKCTLLFLFTLSLLALYTLHHHPLLPSPSSLTAANVFLSSASNYTVSAYLRHLTLRPHLAGTPLSLSTALYVHSHFQSLGLTAHTTNFSALLSYPAHSSLSAHFSNGTVLPVPLPEPGVSGSGVVPPYHAYSPSGAAYGPAVFLNYGRNLDYRALAAQGVEVKGCVGLVRRGCGVSRHEAAANAAAHGVAALLMYTEGEYREGVERGTVMKGVGDPLTPGWAGGEKLDPDDPRVARRFPTVPSLPVSQAAAERILGSLEGGRMPFEWRESFKTGDRRISGVGPGPTKLNFTYKGKQEMATIHNVFAVIKGSEEADRYVLLGNHRDAWTYGAVDPNSGTAALLDIARRFALLMQSGWSPRRSIILCSWDAEEFGMIGSTEWVEQNLLNLGSKAVAYFNVDCAVQGPGLFISATPQLDDLLVEVTKQVKDPDSENAYLYERWAAANRGVNIQRLSRVDSDFAPFLQHAGIASVDLYFGIDFPVYHTAFDSYDWMMNFGDPLFHRHVAATGIWGLIALRLADDPILPFNYLSYATELQEYKNTLNTLLGESISLDPITAAIQEFTKAAYEADEEIKNLRVDKNTDRSTVLRRRALNDRLMLTERGFLDPEGLPGRQWFKHLIYGPRGDADSKIDFFPGIVDGVSERRKGGDGEATIRHEIWRASRAIQRAASALRGELT
ncbi:probable glutamate carboxypeptidase AMP1 isoform X2 [Salvia miltiorrhiza]|uniref:probable glutamate carboxypeptidase AMP1 isoform X2 n=1 Tax=Salvia miltiorrhiza TaxID=226208 RepID=UPI0025ABE051|nr:probable glutamate carboxypeptidase AMP1 isoform X2 [Salvia miltiorrhiza]